MRDLEPRRPLLRFRLGGGEASFEFLQREIVVGSSPDVDLRLDGEGMCERHVRFEWEGERCFLTSLVDESPVLVNGIPRREWLLRDGDRLLLGKVEVGFAWPGARPVEAVPVVVPAPTPAPGVSPRPLKSADTGAAGVYTLRREDRCESARTAAPERRSIAHALGIFSLVVLVTAVIGIIVYAAVGSRDSSKEDGSLHPFAFYAIRSLSDRLERQPIAARLVLRRCRYFLENFPDSPSAERVREIRENAERYLSPEAGWSFEEMDYATSLFPPVEMPAGLYDFDREKREILQIYLQGETDPRRRHMAEQRLRDMAGS